MNYEINQDSQEVHPEIGVRVTEISQEVITDNYEDFRKGGFSNWYGECMLETSYQKILDYRTFKNYFKQGLTPIQAVKKYFL
jgi:hypothetical protein